ncbi:MAG: c-type cytochrome [Dehalococcoidia bacterium]
MVEASRWLLKGRGRWLTLLVFVGILAAACSTGSYPVDVFTEMHYQQSYKSQEPPRLEPAQGAVPFTDASLPLRPLEPTQTEALTMKNPVPRTPENPEQGKLIYITNCSACHGLSGRADTFIANRFKELDINPPADLTKAPSIINTQTDGLAFSLITNGIINMPPFRNLLTQEERWTVIHYLRFLSEQANQ